MSGKIAGNTRPKVCKKNDVVFHQYLRIGQFVLDDVLCGTRYYQYASVDCSRVTQKIHMREIEVEQGVVCMMKMMDFMIRGR